MNGLRLFASLIGVLPLCTFATGLKEAEHYSAYIFGNFTSNSGNAEGGLAVGGDISLNGYGLATTPNTITTGYSLLVEGNAHFVNGRIYQGNVRVGGVIDFSSAVMDGLPEGTLIENLPPYPSIIQSKEYFTDLSTSLSEHPANGQVDYEWGGLYLKGDCTNTHQVFAIDGQQLGNAHTFDVSCIPGKATIVFNISGTSVDFDNLSLASLLPHRERVIFNFYQATTLNVAGISIEGVVLAPNAHINAPHGDAQGTVIADSWYGSMHLGYARFSGNLSPFTNHAPSIESQPLLQIQLPDSYQYQVLATDIDGDQLTYKLLQAPQGAAIDSSSGLITWQAAIEQLGKNAFKVEVSDGQADDTQQFEVEVLAAANLPPVANAAHYTLNEDEYINISLSAADDASVDELVFTILTQPKFGNLTGAGQHWRYQPHDNYYGQDSLTFRVNDGVFDSNSATVTFEIQAVNDAPAAADINIETQENQLVSVQLQAVDPDSSHFSFSILSTPQHGVISLTDNSLQYTPNAGFVGIEQLLYTAHDGELVSNVATITVKVLEENKAPVITSAPSLAAVEDVLFSYDVNAEDANIEDVLNFRFLAAPVDAAIDATTGLIQWLPSNSYAAAVNVPNPYCAITKTQDATFEQMSDVVVVVDESGSMSGEQAWIGEMIPLLHTHLNINEIGSGNVENSYSLLGFASGNRQINVGESVFGSVKDFVIASKKLSTSRNGIEDGWSAIKAAIDNPMREGSARNVILITDEDRDNTDGSITFDSLKNEMLSVNAILNVAVDANFVCGDGVTQALGLGQNGIGYVADGSGGYTLCSGVTVTKAFGTTVADYVDLALSLEGAAWDLNVLRSGGLDAQSFSKAFIAIKVQEIKRQIEAVAQQDIALTSLHYFNQQAIVNVYNPSSLDITSPISIVISDQQRALGAGELTGLAAGQQTTLTIALDAVPQSDVSAEATLQNTDANECLTSNNHITAALFHTEVSDAAGLTDNQVFALAAADSNSAPIIVSSPVTTAAIDTLYSYQVIAQDADRGDAMVYRLLQGPVGMTLDAYSGRLEFRPLASQVGEHAVSVQVSDLRGEVDTQEFELLVDGSYLAPKFTSTPNRRAIEGTIFTYLAEAVYDPTANVSFHLLFGPDDMTIDATSGQLLWAVPGSSKGNRYQVILQVKDQLGNYDIQSFILTSDLAPVAPVITTSSINVATQNKNFSHTFTATDANVVDSKTWQLIQGPANSQINSETGVFSWQPANVSTPGNLTSFNAACFDTDSVLRNLELSSFWTVDNINLSQPLVAPLFDSNQDGLLTAEDQRFVIGINTNRHIVALNAHTGEKLWQRTDLGAHRYNTGAAVNLDNDSNVEFVFVQESTGKLIALNSDGSTRWMSDHSVADVSSSNYNYSGVYTADVDGDGVPELIYGPSVFSAQGQRLWHFTLPSQVSTQKSATGNTLVVDIDGDGQQELVHFNEVRNQHGQLLFKFPDSSPQRTLYYTQLAYGNFDQDDNPELVVNEYTNRGNYIKLIDHDGALLWETRVNYVGPLNLADVNRDGKLEIYSSSNNSLFNGQTGALIWRNGQEASMRGAALADLDLDGWLDILRYNPNGRLMAYKAATGELSTILPYGYSSSAQQGAPVFVDVDADGHAELVTAGTEVRVFKSRHVNWQHADTVYAHLHQTKGAVTSDVKPVMSPLPYFGVSGEPAGEPIDDKRLADLSLSYIRARTVGSNIEISYSIINRGTKSSSAGTKLSMFADVIDEGSRVAEVILPALAINQTHTATLLIDAEIAIGQSLVAQLEQSDVNNCSVENDRAIASVVKVQVIDSDELVSSGVWAVGVQQENLTAPISVVAPGTAMVNSLYRAQVTATDPNPDDHVRFYFQTAPTGATLDSVTGEITWTPKPHQVSRYSFVVRALDSSFAVRSSTFTVAVSADADANVTPRITSVPARFASAGYGYFYDVKAVDSSDDMLRFSLKQAPSGMSINAVSGEVSWVPDASQLGEAVVEIEVKDLAGNTDSQLYTIDTKTNAIPVITSTPIQHVYSGNTYQYTVSAEDADGDDIVYSLTAAPAGMAIDGNNGSVVWHSAMHTIGQHLVVIRASDVLGAYTEQSYALTVRARVSDNSPPLILSHPAGHVFAATDYQYQVTAQDSDGDALSYLLLQSPPGMTIGRASGLLQWQPSASQIGAFDVALQVEDSKGGAARQSYQLTVSDSSAVNNLPVISSIPAVSAKAGYAYHYTVEATDADADTLTYQLLYAPEGMTLSANGNLQWLPQVEQWADVTLRVSDGKGYVEQGWTIRVASAEASLNAQIEINPAFVYENEQLTIKVKPVNAVPPLTVSLMVDGQAVALDDSYSAQLTATGLGSHTVVATLQDAYDNVQVTSVFDVRDPNETPVPAFAIVSPENNAVVSSATNVVINIAEPNVANWRLMFTELGSERNGYQLLAEGSEPVLRKSVASFDPSTLRNGLYQLLLLATYQDGSTATQDVTLSVEGSLKIGNYSVSFEDVNIAVAGMPVIVTRTYDSRDKGKLLDFGQGWRVDYQNVRLQESRVLGRGWSVNEYRSGFFSNWCVEPDGDPIVSISLPDGRVEKFKAKANPHCQQLVPATDVTLEFEAMPGTTSKLVQKNYGQLRVNAGNLLDLTDPGVDVDPNLYQLTTVDGYIFNINEGFSIDSIVTPTGHTVTYTAEGVIHSDGLSVNFERDAQNRIKRILLPDNTAITYDYDANGDLIAHHDVLQQATRFSYDNQHNLLDITSANDVAVIRNEYDDAGRLIAQTDAEGNRLEFTHDVASNRQVITDRRGNRSVFTYDEMGNVLTETNALGETISRTYDAAQNVLSQTDALGNTTSWTYDDKRNKLTETNALGYTTTFTYNPLNKLLTEQDDDGITLFSNEYAPDGNITKSTDAAGQVTEFSYNPRLAELETISDSIGVQSQFSYSKAGNAYFIATMTNSEGAVTEYLRDAMGRTLTETRYRTLDDGSVQTLVTSFELDAKGRVISTTDARGNKSLNEYDVFDNETANTNALGQRTEYQFDVRGNLTQTRYPDGSSESREYDAENNLITLTDRNGNVTRYQYDAANRRIVTEFADSSTERNEYDAAGRLAAVVDARGNRTEYQYDGAGQQVQVKDAAGNITQYQYDKRGNRTVMIDANNQRFEYQYDAANNLIRTTYPDATNSSSEYDVRGRLVAETDQAGVKTHYHYDGMGRLTKVVNVAGDETTYQYDEQGNKLSQTDANGNITRWNYDELGNVLSRTLPLGQTEYFTYDVIGNRLSHTDFNGNVSQYFYDVNNRLVRIAFADGSAETYSYDNNGNRLAASNSEGTWAYQYDARNRVIAETQPDGSVLSYQYDSAGNKVATTVTLADGSVSTEQFSYDAQNRLLTVSWANQLQMSYSYDALGNKVSELHANGNNSVYRYDSLGRLLTVRHFNAGGALLNEFDYTLDATGRRLQIREADGRLTQYGYDNLYRLVSESISNTQSIEYQAQYQFDATGNRVQQTINGVVTDYSYDANDRLQHTTSSGAQTVYGYDDNGNTLSKDVNGTVTSYQYNLTNRLVQADSTQTSGGMLAQFYYNVDGIRTRKVVDGTAINYLVDANQPYAQVIAETNDIGQAIKTYLYGDDLISQTDANNQTHSFHYDGLGSTRLLSDDSGNVSDQYSYAAFGELLSSIGDTDNNYLFTGEQYDDSVDNYYLRARYYSPEIGRFTRQDEWLGRNNQPITLNKYIYGNQDPILYVDYSGNMANLSESQIVNTVMSGLSRNVTVNFRVVLQESGCYAVTYLFDEAIDKGIYMFMDQFMGLPYVGKTEVDFETRKQQHINEGKRKVDKFMSLFHVSDGIKGSVLREFEQMIMDMFGTPGKSGSSNKTLSNDINSINKAKRKALKALDKICK